MDGGRWEEWPSPPVEVRRPGGQPVGQVDRWWERGRSNAHEGWQEEGRGDLSHRRSTLVDARYRTSGRDLREDRKVVERPRLPSSFFRC